MNDIKKYLPSKKFTIILSSIIFAIAIISITKIFIDINNKNKEKIAVAQKEEIKLREKFLELDSDNDGLKDWEEALWKTNINNPDTDEDGTNDGDEVKAYRDPLISGPNDRFSEAEIAETKKMIDEYTSLNETEKFSRTLFSNFLATQQTNREMSESEIQNFVDSTINQLDDDRLIAKTHKLEEITIVEDLEVEDLDSYRQKLALLLEDNFFTFIAADPSILEVALSKNDPENLKQLDKSIQSYKKLISELLTTKTPSIFANDHLIILNLTEELLYHSTNLRNYFENPILVVPALSAYGKIIIALEIPLQNIGLLSK